MNTRFVSSSSASTTSVASANGRGFRGPDLIFLPFEDDSRFDLILSKALLAAEDKKIRDPVIVNQIRS